MDARRLRFLRAVEVQYSTYLVDRPAWKLGSRGWVVRDGCQVPSAIMVACPGTTHPPHPSRPPSIVHRSRNRRAGQPAEVGGGERRTMEEGFDTGGFAVSESAGHGHRASIPHLSCPSRAMPQPNPHSRPCPKLPPFLPYLPGTVPYPRCGLERHSVADGVCSLPPISNQR